MKRNSRQRHHADGLTLTHCLRSIAECFVFFVGQHGLFELPITALSSYQTIDDLHIASRCLELTTRSPRSQRPPRWPIRSRRILMTFFAVGPYASGPPQRVSSSPNIHLYASSDLRWSKSGLRTRRARQGGWLFWSRQYRGRSGFTEFVSLEDLIR